jgi:hypothetical protein
MMLFIDVFQEKLEPLECLLWQTLFIFGKKVNNHV